MSCPSLIHILEELCHHTRLRQAPADARIAAALTTDEGLAATYHASIEANDSIIPEFFVSGGGCLGEENKYHAGRQGDPHEFIAKIFEADGLVKGACTGLDQPRLSCARCGCGRLAAGAEAFSMLQLPLVNSITGARYRTTREALDALMSPVRVDLADWECSQEECQLAGVHKLSPWKSVNFAILPRVLIVQFVRWKADLSLVDHSVMPDGVLNIDGMQFHLRSIVCHQGDAAHGGHYVCFAWHSGVWWLYNDSQRRPAHAGERAAWTRSGCTDKVYLALYDQQA